MSLFRALFITLAIIGCVDPQLQIEEIPLSANPESEIARLEGELLAAAKNGVDAFSPVWYGRAADSLRTAKHLRQSGSGLQSIFSGLETSRAELRKGEGLAAMTKAAYPRLVVARQDALTAGANIHTEGFKPASVELTRLATFRDLGNNAAADATVDAAIEAWRTLELNAIRDNYLAYARTTIRNVEGADGEELVPGTLAHSNSELRKADHLIQQDRYAKDKIKAATDRLNFFADRLAALHTEARKVTEMTPEKIAIRHEAMVYDLAQKIDAGDLRNKQFSAQYAAIAAAAAMHKKQLEAESDKLKRQAAMKDQKVLDLTGRVQRLEQEDDLLSSLSSLFKKGEADVYRQDKSVIVRLKDMAFPVGQTTLTPDNEKLLNKVAAGITKLPAAAIVVEGHTDAVGGLAVNRRISMARATIVKDYLRKLLYFRDSFQFKAVGKADTQPIATNKTKAGRAMNRRIDIVIVPQKPDMSH